MLKNFLNVLREEYGVRQISEKGAGGGGAGGGNRGGGPTGGGTTGGKPAGGGAPKPAAQPAQRSGGGGGGNVPPPVDDTPAPAAPKAAAPKPAAPQNPLGGTVTPQNAPAASQKFQGTIKDFQRLNPGATVGQAMNAIQGKTARAGGANDPKVIQTNLNKQFDRDRTGSAPKAFDPNAPRGGSSSPAGISPADRAQAAKPAPATPTPAGSAGDRLPGGATGSAGAERQATQQNIQTAQTPGGPAGSAGDRLRGDATSSAGAQRQATQQNIQTAQTPGGPAGSAGDRLPKGSSPAPDERTTYQKIAPSFLGGKEAPATPQSATGSVSAGGAPSSVPSATVNTNFNQKIPANTPSGSAVSGTDVNYNKTDPGSKTLVQRIGDFFGGGEKPAAPANPAPATPAPSSDEVKPPNPETQIKSPAFDGKTNKVNAGDEKLNELRRLAGLAK